MRIMRNLNNKKVKSAKIPHYGNRELPEIQKTFVKSAKIPHYHSRLHTHTLDKGIFCLYNAEPLRESARNAKNEKP
jgi:hypothetical protein